MAYLEISLTSLWKVVWLLVGQFKKSYSLWAVHDLYGGETLILKDVASWGSYFPVLIIWELFKGSLCPYWWHKCWVKSSVSWTGLLICGYTFCQSYSLPSHVLPGLWLSCEYVMKDWIGKIFFFFVSFIICTFF